MTVAGLGAREAIASERAKWTGNANPSPGWLLFCA
jgi:hypothetical protein